MEVQLSQKQHVLLSHGQCIVSILHHCQTWCTALYDPGVGFVILRATPPRWHSNHHPLKGKVVPGRTHEHQKSLLQDIRASGQKEAAWLKNVVVSVWGVDSLYAWSSYREAPGFCPLFLTQRFHNDWGGCAFGQKKTVAEIAPMCKPLKDRSKVCKRSSTTEVKQFLFFRSIGRMCGTCDSKKIEQEGVAFVV